MTDEPYPVFERNWTFGPSQPSAPLRLSRLKSLATGLRRPPATAAIRAITPRARWNVLFLYAPQGALTAAQRFTMARLREMDGGLAIVCATSRIDMVADDDAFGVADALYWKALPGFDFSAYSIALNAVTTESPGADVYVQNDSILGPFGDIDGMLSRTPWHLTGFLANAALENHIQSYAFYVRAVDPSMLRALRTVFPTRWSCDDWRDVINLQETRLARVAARSVSVGAFWFAPSPNRGEFGLIDSIRQKLLGGPTAAVHDPGLVHATTLLDEGFPFLKKSLFEKNRGYQNVAHLNDRLRAQGHPAMVVPQHG